MAPFTLSSFRDIAESEIIELYDSVGWKAYTNTPNVLFAAIKNSSFVASAWDDDGKLVGLARAISDDSTICYIQDILVRPDLQRTGIGRALFQKVKERYRHVRQTVLITDDEPRQHAFYRSMGLTEGSAFRPDPLRVFAEFK